MDQGFIKYKLMSGTLCKMLRISALTSTDACTLYNMQEGS